MEPLLVPKLPVSTLALDAFKARHAPGDASLPTKALAANI